MGPGEQDLPPKYDGTHSGVRDPDRGIIELVTLNLSVAKEVCRVGMAGHDG